MRPRITLRLAVALLSVQLSAQAEEIRPGQGVEFQQVSWSFPTVEQRFTDWVRVTMDPQVLFEMTGIRRGYINVDCDAGWIVQNILVDLSDPGGLATYARVGIDRPFEGRLFSASVDFATGPRVDFSRRTRRTFQLPEYTVRPGGVGPPPRRIPESPKTIFEFTDEENFSVMLPNTANVHAAQNQCYPMAMANSLQYLENRYGLLIPQNHVRGEGRDNTLVGRLDFWSGRPVRSRTDGDGRTFPQMTRGKFAYLAANELTDSLTHKHQGRGFGVPDGDLEFQGSVSRDEGETLTFDWICDEIKAGNDVELLWSYDDQDSGHAVRVVGCGKQNGVPWIKYIHDSEQAGEELGDLFGLEPPVQAFIADIDDDGFLNLESISIELRVAQSESVSEELRTRANAPPQTSTAGIVNGASFQSSALTPGGISTMYGIFLEIELDGGQNQGLGAEGASQGLPTTMGGAAVFVNMRPAPLYAALASQINFQIPYETEPGQASVFVEVNGRRSATWSVAVGETGPGVFILPESIAGPGRAIAQNVDFSLHTPENPVAPGGLIIIYLTGLGEVTNQPADGELAPAGPLAEAIAPVSATIGDVEATVQFAGLTPQSIGLAQANLFVPQLPPGNHAVVITVGGRESNPLLITVGPD